MVTVVQDRYACGACDALTYWWRVVGRDHPEYVQCRRICPRWYEGEVRCGALARYVGSSPHRELHPVTADGSHHPPGGGDPAPITDPS